MTIAAVGGEVRARLRTWPYEPDVAQIVLIDHAMTPDATDVGRWLDTVRQRGSGVVRTGALFPQAARAFTAVGFEPIDTLALLDLRLDQVRIDHLRSARRSQSANTHRMRQQQLHELAALDRAAFGDPWGNDTSAVSEIASATPRHRARVIKGSDGLIGYGISGLAGNNGYVQRLAVHPSAHGNGHGRTLLVDGLEWMHRRGATRALVNTGVDNQAALELYVSCGFTRCPEQLVILEATIN